MFLTLGGVLGQDDLTRVRGKTVALSWRDGARTAGPSARTVKRNEQADLSDGAGKGLRDFLLSALDRHAVFQSAARPKRISPLMLSRTGVGGGYGNHIDNALMRGLRTDLSFTLFLSDPETYEGGALALDTPGGVVRARPAAGDLVLYPSGAIHQVEPVTAGVRLACVGWVESRVRRADQREILFDLETVRAGLEAGSAERLILDKTLSNLLRMWAET